MANKQDKTLTRCKLLTGCGLCTWIYFSYVCLVNTILGCISLFVIFLSYDGLIRILTNKQEYFKALLSVRFYSIFSEEVLTKTAIIKTKEGLSVSRTYLVGGSYALSAYTHTKSPSRNVDIFLPFLDSLELEQFDWSLLEFNYPSIGVRTEYSRDKKESHLLFDSNILAVSSYVTDDGVEVRFYCVKVNNINECVIDTDFAACLNRLCDFFTRIYFRLDRHTLRFQYQFPAKDIRYIRNKQVPMDETKINSERRRKYVERGWSVADSDNK